MAGFNELKISDANVGLELDKMEILTISKSTQVQDSGYRGIQQGSYSTKSLGKNSILKMLLLVSGVLLPIVLLFLLWDQGVVDLPLLKSNKVRREHQRFATVGPVMTSIGQNQHIKMTVRIECKNTRLKEKVAEIESAVKSKLLFVLSSPEVKEKLRLQDYAAIKAFFKKEVDSLLPNDTVEAVYFSEIIRY